jgi:twinkle protein
MGTVVELHRPCPNCGSSDALSVYADGGAKCFSCGRSWKDFYHKGTIEQSKDFYHKGKGDKQPMKDIVEDAGRIPVNGIPDRHLTTETCKVFGVKVIVKDGGIAQHIYPYHDSAGNLVAQKIRTVEGKQFSWRGPSHNATFFGQNLFPAKGRFITITEGELDAMAVYQMSGGKSATVSIKGGAESALKEVKNNYQYLDSFDNIIVCFDGDAAGQKAAKKVAEILPPKKVKIVKMPKDCKDACEFLKQGKTSEFNSLWWKAEEYRPDDIVNYSDLWERVLDFSKNRTYIPTPWEGLNEKICGFREGQLVTFAAGTGMGKSAFLRAIIYHYLKTTDVKIGAMFLEEVAEDTVVSMMSLEGGLNLRKPDVWKAQSESDLKHWFEESGANRRIELYDGFDFDDIDLLMDKIRYLNRARDCKIIILDHLTMVVDDAENSTQALNKLVADLKKIAVELGIIIVTACHLRKSQNAAKQSEEGGRVTLDDLKQSSSVKQLSDIVIGLERNGQSDDPSEANTTKIRVLKDRDFGSKGVAAAVVYDKDTTRLTEISLEDIGDDE